ncbi:unnamed protein product [Chrysodeixis includens]|uniref:Peptidase S1 domain-containing protein n=1 Tax=Chrysodeixis includens TaxID=689277 RepID=A0A9N8Q135_CHRIL|nr:unnamed protein product [Chrysodeixis includens]
MFPQGFKESSEQYWSGDDEEIGSDEQYLSGENEATGSEEQYWSGENDNEVTPPSWDKMGQECSYMHMPYPRLIPFKKRVRFFGRNFNNRNRLRFPFWRFPKPGPKKWPSKKKKLNVLKHSSGVKTEQFYDPCKPLEIPPMPDFRAPERRISDVVSSDPENTNSLTLSYDSDSNYQGAIGWKAVVGTWKFMCGATLISNNFVLTAAHCSSASGRDTTIADVTPKIVRLGDKNILDTVRSTTTSPELVAATVDIIDSKECDMLLNSSFNRNFHGLRDHQLCAGKIKGGADSCEGTATYEKHLPLFYDAVPTL